MRPFPRAHALASAVVLTASTLLVLSPRADAAPNHRLDRDVVPTFQSVRLRLDPARTEYTGKVHIDVTVNAATDSFRLYARDLDLLKVALTGPAGEITVRHESGRAGLLVVRTERPLAPGAYGLDIDFMNEFNTKANSLYRLETGGAWYAFTQFEPDAAREAFPCWDEPEFKIPFQLTLVVPATGDAVSNTPIEKSTTQGSEKTVVFARTEPLPTYLVALAVGTFEYTPIKGMSVPGRVVTVKGAARMAAEAARITPLLMAELEKYFGRKYPYAKLDLLAVPEFGAGAMENAGAITFRDEILLVDPATASPRQRYGMMSTTAHELAHMWFGDLVTMEWWDDLWLNEAFASWMGDKMTERVAPQYQTPVRALRGTQGALRTDARPSTRAIRQPVDAFDNFELLFDELAYNKGQAVLGMLETWMGPETFRNGMLRYLEKHAWKNATAADLWAALSEASGKDIAAATGSFLNQPGVPLVSVEPLPDGRVRLQQRRFFNAAGEPPAAATWKIPVTLKYSDGRQSYTQSVLLAEAEQIVKLEKTGAPAWVHGNAGERGYYLWSVPPEMLERLAVAAPNALDTRERVGFLNNLSALLDGGVVRGDDYIRTLGRFADDVDAEVLNTVLDGLERVHTAFVTPSVEGAFMLTTRKLLRPALDRFGLAKMKGEAESVSLMRPNLLMALAIHGNDAQVIEWARVTARAYLARPESVDPAVAGPALEIAARSGDDSLFHTYRRRFETTKIPAERNRYLAALGNFRNAKLMEWALDYTLLGPLRPQEVFTIPREIAENEVLKDRVWEWFKRNYQPIVKRIPPFFVSSLPYWASCCSEPRIEDARMFFNQMVQSPTGTREELAKVIDSIKDCVGLRQREGAAAARYLQSFAQAKAAKPAP